MKMMFLYIQELYREDDKGETPVQSPAAPVSPRSSIVEKPGSAGKVIGFLILAAAIVAVVYFMQT